MNIGNKRGALFFIVLSVLLLTPLILFRSTAQAEFYSSTIDNPESVGYRLAEAIDTNNREYISNADGSGDLKSAMIPCNAMSAAILLTPANGATGVSTTPDLVWSGAADSFDVWICSISNCQAGASIRFASTSGTHWTVSPPLDPNATYYWQVRTNVDNCGYTNSIIGSFSTAQAANYTLSLAKTGNGSVKVNGASQTLPWSGQFASDSQVELEAVAESGWSFSNWSGDYSGSANPTTITMNGNKTVNASFSQQAGSGIVLSSVTPDPFGPGITLTLSGSGFGAKKGSVMFGKTKAKIMEWHDTWITCSLSNGKAGVYPVKVGINNVGESNVLNCTLSSPVIDNINPSYGNANTTVTINGHYFGVKKPKVQFISSAGKAKNVKITGSSDTQLSVVVPKVSAGTFQVFITSKAGKSLPYHFNVGIPPAAQTGVIGRVTDVNGSPIANVLITGSATTTTTDNGGNFTLSEDVGKEKIIVFTKDGYLSSSKYISVYQGAMSYLPVTLTVIAAPITLSTESGGTVTGSRSSSLTAPPDAFMDADGTPVTGSVEVSLTPLDPAIAEEAKAYPGELRGLTLSGKIVPLKTYGVMDITVKQSGKVLRVKEGRTVNIALPAPSKGQKPDTVQTWYYDTKQALWIQSASDATYDPGKNIYNLPIVSGIPLDLPFNCDKPSDPTCIYGIVEDASGKPIVGAHITAKPAENGEGTGIYSSMNTGTDGNYCMTVERNTDVLLTVETPDGVSTERRITPGSSVSQDYPANCSSSNCKQIRTIVAGTPDPGESTDCNIGSNDPSTNVFSGTCLSILDELFACFHPEGKCIYKIDINGGNYEATYDNGSKLIIDQDGLKCYGPNPTNAYCGKMVFSNDINSSYDTTIILASGKSDSYTTKTNDDGSVEIICKNGSTFRLDGKQMDAFAGCSGQSDNSGNKTACTAAPGSWTGPCINSFECDQGLKCCGVFEKNVCLEEYACEFICSSNYECDQSLICCSNGIFDECLPINYCR